MLVLSHHLENGTDKPIAFSTRSLASVKEKYSQLEKDSLAIVFGVHQDFFGRNLVITSGHKPLQHCFIESKATPVLASA